MDWLRRFILLSVYSVAPPFYMICATFLLDDYSGRNNFLKEHIFPFLSVTIWIALIFAFGANYVWRRYRQKHLLPGEKVKDYPLIFVFVYSVYFLLVGCFFWGADCLYAAFSGLSVVFWVLIFHENMRRCVEYLPAVEKFYFYVVAFVYPIFILMMSDALSLIENTPWHMTILLSPIAYVPGVTVFACACLMLKIICRMRESALKKNVFGLTQAILLLLIGDVSGCLYLVPYVGRGIFLVGFVMSFGVYLIELFYHYKRHQRLKTAH